jgi:hypothetical protein
MFLKYNTPALVWIIAMTVLFLIPGDSLPDTEGWSFLMLDKLFHFGLFAVLVFLLVWGFAKQKKFNFLHKQPFQFSLLIGFIYAVVAEFLQQLTINRAFEWQDMLANIIGCIGGLLVFYGLNKLNSD